MLSSTESVCVGGVQTITRFDCPSVVIRFFGYLTVKTSSVIVMESYGGCVMKKKKKQRKQNKRSKLHQTKTPRKHSQITSAVWPVPQPSSNKLSTYSLACFDSSRMLTPRKAIKSDYTVLNRLMILLYITFYCKNDA